MMFVTVYVVGSALDHSMGDVLLDKKVVRLMPSLNHWEHSSLILYIAIQNSVYDGKSSEQRGGKVKQGDNAW
jgi:hypothetical protein